MTMDPRSTLAALLTLRHRPDGTGTLGELAQEGGRYGLRQDGAPKGRGYYGELARPDGDVSTELSVGVDFGDGETEIPLLAPGLSYDQIQRLLRGEQPTPGILRNAVERAQQRLFNGQSPFATEKDELLPVPPGAPELYWNMRAQAGGRVNDLPELQGGGGMPGRVPLQGIDPLLERQQRGIAPGAPLPAGQPGSGTQGAGVGGSEWRNETPRNYERLLGLLRGQGMTDAQARAAARERLRTQGLLPPGEQAPAR